MKSYSILFLILVFLACSDGPKVNNADLIIRNGAKYLKTSTEPFTGIGIVERDVNGRRLEITYKNGVQHGSSYLYSPTGIKLFKAVYDKGNKISSIVWYESGARRSNMKYTGLNSGIEETWHPNGKRASISTIQNNQSVPGSETFWDEEGNEIK